MRIGYTTSVIGHAILLAVGLVSLPGAEPFEVEQIDALPVDLVPIDEVTQLSEGVKTAPKADTASQAKITPPLPRPDSARPGAAPVDQDTPVTETARETAAAPIAEAAPPPPPPPAAKAEPEPEPPAPEPEPEPEVVETPPAETAPPPEAEVAEAPAEAPPAPVPPSAKPRAKPKPPKPVEVASAETTASTERRPAPEPAKPTPPVERKPEPKEPEFDPTEMAALLNKIDPSGGGGRASTEEASLGSRNVTGAVANMSQSELDALRAAIEACWTPPVGAEGVDGMMVPIRVEFNIDGTLAAEPIAREVPPGPVGRVMAEAALRAVRRCAPYPFLPAEKYDAWRTVNINFRPPAMF